MKGSRVGESVVGFAVGLDEGTEELLGLVLGESLVAEGLIDTLGDRDGKSLGLADGGSIA